MNTNIEVLQNMYRDVWYSFYLNHGLTSIDRLNLLELMSELENDIIEKMDDVGFFSFLDSLPFHNEYWTSIPDIFDIGENSNNG